MSARGAHASFPQWPCGAQEPLQELPQFTGIGILAEVVLNVGDCATQDVQIVMESIELPARDHQLALAEFEFVRALACNPVPLTTPL